jgi:hypothetical protein
MGQVKLYEQYDRREIIAHLGSGAESRSLCGDQWVIFPAVVIGLVEIGDAPKFSRFPSSGEFCWVADKSYRVSDERYARFVPTELLIRHVNRPICLFVKPRGSARYRYVGELKPANTFKSGGKENFGEASFRISPALPSDVWVALGGLHPGSLDHPSLDLALERLREPTSVEDRLDILREVVNYWHGPIGLEDGLPDRDLDGLRIPEPLRWWYLWAGRRTEILSGQNRLLGPSELRTKDDRLVFYVENQWCYEWATPFEGDDPPIFGRSESTDPWEPESMTLSEHLILACLFEAIMCRSPYGASTSWLKSSIVEEIAGQIPPIAIGSWNWGGSTRFHAGGGALMLTMPNGEIGGERGFSIWIGAKTEHPLQFLRPYIDDRWEYTSF